MTEIDNLIIIHHFLSGRRGEESSQPPCVRPAFRQHDPATAAVADSSGELIASAVDRCFVRTSRGVR